MADILTNISGLGIAALALLLGYRLAVIYIADQTKVISGLKDAIDTLREFLITNFSK